MSETVVIQTTTTEITSTVEEIGSIPVSVFNVEDDILEDPQLASAMREGTKAIHKAAEESVFTKKFLKGDITLDEYGRYINSLYYVYSSMEALLEKHKNDPAVENIFFPEELNRKEVLLRDLEHYYGKERLAKVIAPSAMTPAVKAYINAMEDACKVNPALLVAYSYTRYLGDLSGGQILAKRLKKAVLQLNEKDSAWDSTKGLEFYYFDHIGNQNEFKALYRERLDGAKVSQKTKDLIVEEALKCFAFNIDVFDEIHELSQAKKLISIDEKEGFVVPSSYALWGALAAGVAAIGTGVFVYSKQR
ncbi:heme oxygenase-domain-containing protein [Phycomyces nitens]|nr:heme oxygenase-domain-containing protein [Phycomyces nitens]